MVAREGLYLRLAGVGGLLYLLHHAAHSPHPLAEGNGQGLDRTCTVEDRGLVLAINLAGVHDRGRGHVPATVDLRS